MLPESLFTQGLIHELKLITPPPAVSIADYYHDAAEQGLPEAQFAYARHLLEQHRYDEAADMLNKSAAHSFTAAQRALGIFYLWHDRLEAAAQQLRMAAQAGCIESMMLLVSHALDQTPEAFAERIQWLTIAIESKHPVACQNLGIYYYHGIHVDQNKQRALSIFQHGADTDPNCAIAAALILDRKHTANEALSYWQSAAERGYADAMIVLAEKYQRGIGVPQNTQTAEYWRVQADQKDPTSNRTEQSMSYMEILEVLDQIYLGSLITTEIPAVFSELPIQKLLYARLSGIDSVEAARSWLTHAMDSVSIYNPELLTETEPSDYLPEKTRRIQRAAQAGQIDAQQAYAQMLLKGEGIEKNVTAALHWLSITANTSPITQFYLAGLYRHGQHGIEPDLEKALIWLQKAADNDIPYARWHLANELLNTDENTAFQHLKILANQAAQLNQHANNMWCQQRFATASPMARQYLEQQAVTNAQQGNLLAQIELGLLYKYLAENENADYYILSVQAFEKANTHLTAQFYLGLLHLKGLGVIQNNTQAFTHIKQATRNWSPISDYGQERIPVGELPFIIGQMYEYGWGTDADYASALYWYKKGAAFLLTGASIPMEDYWIQKTG